MFYNYLDVLPHDLFDNILNYNMQDIEKQIDMLERKINNLENKLKPLNITKYNKFTEITYDKVFYFRDIFPLISGFVDFMIAGNSKRQYFQDLPASLKNNQPPNYTLTYWEEDFQGIKAYNIGMGNGLPYSSFVSFKLENKLLFPYSTTIKLSNDGLDKMGLVDMNYYSATVRDKVEDKLTILNRIIIYFKMYQNLIFGFIVGIIFVYLTTFLKLKYFYK